MTLAGVPEEAAEEDSEEAPPSKKVARKAPGKSP